ncbi:uncharacterized protein DS421_15g498520 [Arachis hypogaea]|nr:uncharacterized protein DS421_15g498520 [Arachis hypogaea]
MAQEDIIGRFRKPDTSMVHVNVAHTSAVDNQQSDSSSASNQGRGYNIFLDEEALAVEDVEADQVMVNWVMLTNLFKINNFISNSHMQTWLFHYPHLFIIFVL